jgi:hypothetical protein
MIYRSLDCFAAGYAQCQPTAVFIEAVSRNDARDRLVQGLAAIWGVPADAVEISPPTDEQELMRNSIRYEIGQRLPLRDDLTLIECGSRGDEPFYFKPHEVTLLLPNPSMLRVLNVMASVSSQTIP